MRKQTKVQELTIEEALKLPALKNAKLIAGKNGVHHTISNAMVLEATDIEKWGRSGLLLLTSFFALSNLSKKEQISFLNKVAAMKMSGIVFKSKRLLNDLPSYFLDTCDKLEIPVIEIDNNTVYETLITAIISEVLHTNNLILEQFYKVHQQTMRLALEQPSFYLILSHLKDLIHCEVTLYMPNDQSQIGTSNKIAKFEKILLTPIEKRPFHTFNYFKTDLTYQDGSQRFDISLLIPSITNTKAYLIIHSNTMNISDLDMVAIENYAYLLMIVYLKQAEIEQKLYLQNNATLHDLLLGRFTTRQDIDAALKQLRIDSHAYYQVMLLRISIKNPKQSNRLPDILNSFKSRLKNKYFNIVIFDTNNRTIFLRNFSSQTTEISLNAVTEILDELNESSTLPKFNYLIAVSSKSDKYSIKRLNDEVISIYNLYDSKRDENFAIDYSNLGVFKLLMNLENLQELPQFIDPRIKRLLENEPKMLQMLVEICANNLNFSHTAEKLFIHPKTINYRLDRIKEKYNLDIHNVDDRMQIMLTEKILMLTGVKNV